MLSLFRGGKMKSRVRLRQGAFQEFLRATATVFPSAGSERLSDRFRWSDRPLIDKPDSGSSTSLPLPQFLWILDVPLDGTSRPSGSRPTARHLFLRSVAPVRRSGPRKSSVPSRVQMISDRTYGYKPTSPGSRHGRSSR